ncbi:Aquaporin-10 [Hypsibius exemplaris]|uniref:Aquaporin-10 n=1 Tax=Hypsibius exemplaris TaxID=2072580 RepID=A0A1W0X272_HYPEX|nr:Aquaporin-10 [Hypsibius exemplaris]
MADERGLEVVVLPESRLLISEGTLQDAARDIQQRDDKVKTKPVGNMPLFKNVYVREFLAEFLGTFILIIFGNGAVAEVVLSAKTNKGGSVNDFFSINIGYGLAVAFGVYVAGGVSGGHLNPAVSLAFAVLKKLKWRKLPVYMLAQYIGAWVGSAVILMIYYDALTHHEVVTGTFRGNDTAGIFASYPQEFLTWGNGLADQIFGTMLLMLGILALTDERNSNPQKGVVPILVGLLITAIGLSFGFNCGYPINPARDLGPRIFTAMAGWGAYPFNVRNFNWFWIPVVGPHIGALIGAVVYKFFIGNHWPSYEENLKNQPLVVHTIHATPATPPASTEYQPLKTSSSSYSQSEYR